MTIVRLAFLCAVLAFSLLPLDRPAEAQTEWLTALRAGGHVIVIRHGATHQDQADTDPFNLANVDKQRQLNDAGRAKAKEIGESFRKLGIPVGQVITSLYFRAIETGKLAFGSAEPTVDVTEGGQEAARSSRRSRTIDVRRRCASLSERPLQPAPTS